MNTDKLSALFEYNQQKEQNELICQALEQIDKDKERREITKQLREKIQSSKNYNDQIRDQIHHETKTIKWDYAEGRLNRNDVEQIWYNLDKTKVKVRKDTVYKLYSDQSGEYITGLRKNIKAEDLQGLIGSNTDNNIMEPMASSRRNRYKDELRCVRKQNNEVHWYTTLKEVKKMTQESRYTKSMIHDLVQDIAKEYLPDFDRYFQTLTLEELTDHLLTQDPLVYEESLYLKPLKNLTRKVDVSLHSICKSAEKLYKLSIKKPNASCDETNDQFDQTLLQFNIDTLVKFTSEKVSKILKDHIHNCKSKGISFTYKNLLYAAIQLEDEDYNNKPKTEIKLNYMTPDELSIKLNNINIQHSSTESDESDNEFYTTKRSNKDTRARPPTPHLATIRQAADARDRQTATHETMDIQKPTPKRNNDIIQDIMSPTDHWKSKLNDIHLDSISENKTNYEQAKIDNEGISAFHTHAYKEMKKRIMATTKTLDKSDINDEKKYKTIIERMKNYTDNKRIIAAFIADDEILQNIHTNNKQSNKVRFDAIMHFFDNELRETRNTHNASINSMRYERNERKNNYSQSPNNRYRSGSRESSRKVYFKNYDENKRYKRQENDKKYNKYRYDSTNRSTSVERPKHYKNQRDKYDKNRSQSRGPRQIRKQRV